MLKMLMVAGLAFSGALAAHDSARHMPSYHGGIGHHDDKSAQVLRRFLAKNSRIQRFSGYHFTVVERPGDSPIITCLYLTEAKHSSSDAIPVFTIGSAPTQEQRVAVDSYNVSLRLAKITDIVLADPRGQGGREGRKDSPELTRFDHLDSAGMHWLSVWYDPTGFIAKTASYDSAGLLRNFDFFSGYVVNGVAKGRAHVGPDHELIFYAYPDLPDEFFEEPSSGRRLDLGRTGDLETFAGRLLRESLEHPRGLKFRKPGHRGGHSRN